MAAKACFGILDRVFPRTGRDLREVPAGCLECPDKTACLKSALATPEGLDLRSALLERRRAGGFFGRIKRWSQKKHLHTLTIKQAPK